MRKLSTSSASILHIVIALLMVYIIWGSTYLAIKLSIVTIPPFLMGASRFFIAGSIMIVVALLRGEFRPSFLQWRNAVIVGLLLLVGGNGTISWAERFVPSGLTALLVSMTPIWMTLLDWLRPGGRRPSPMIVTGLLIGFFGVAVLIGPAFTTPGTMQIIGMIVIPLAALSWAAGSLFARQAPMPKSPVYGTGIEMVAAGVALLIVATFTGEWQHFSVQTVSFSSLSAFLYLIFFGSIVGFTAYVWLLNHVPLALASTYAYVNPVVAVILGTVFAGESMSLNTVFAAILIVSSVVIITTFSSRSLPSPQKQAEENIAIEAAD